MTRRVKLSPKAAWIAAEMADSGVSEEVAAAAWAERILAARMSDDDRARAARAVPAPRYNDREAIEDLGIGTYEGGMFRDRR